MTLRRIKRLFKSYAAMAVVLGWIVYLTILLTLGKIAPEAAFDRLTSSDILTTIANLLTSI
uniref:hypothetical protein n=1 Tax=Methylobacterium sp. B34 TaxID=95563 RepID=UPI0003463DB8|nr:hypothetical protein [Methylobacterium sp. B34]